MTLPSIGRVTRSLHWILASGRRPQAFLDAWWVPLRLSYGPATGRERRALRLLALSPHYFIDETSRQLRGAALDEHLAKVFRELRESRERLFDALAGPFVTADSTCLDLGCGPGWSRKPPLAAQGPSSRVTFRQACWPAQAC